MERENIQNGQERLSQFSSTTICNYKRQCQEGMIYRNICKFNLKLPNSLVFQQPCMQY